MSGNPIPWMLLTWLAYSQAKPYVKLATAIGTTAYAAYRAYRRLRRRK
jgi:hypothetical protein